MAGSDEASEAPRRWVEAFYDSEAEVRGVLDDARESHLLGEYEAVRERLRAFAETEEGIFRMVALAVLDVDSFYDDLEAQYDDDETPPTADLRALGEEYDRLAEEAELVFTERLNGLHNPMPTLRRGFSYAPSMQVPRLEYDLYSGDVELCRFVHPPSQSLMLARAVVACTRELLERVEENDDTVAESERERLAAVFERLAADVAELEAFVDGVEGETADGGGGVEPDDDAPDVYDDWSFY